MRVVNIQMVLIADAAPDLLERVLNRVDPSGELWALHNAACTCIQKPVIKIIQNTDRDFTELAAVFRDVDVPNVWEVHLYAHNMCMRWLDLDTITQLLLPPLYKDTIPWGAFASIPLEKKLMPLHTLLDVLPFVSEGQPHHNDTVRYWWTPQQIQETRDTCDLNTYLIEGVKAARKQRA